MNKNNYLIRFGKVSIFLFLFRAKRLRKVVKSADREFRENGVRSLFRRVRSVFSSPYSILAYNIDEWQKLKKAKKNLILADFSHQKGMISVVIPFIKDGNLLSVKMVKAFLQQSYEDTEVILVLSGYGFGYPKEVKKILRNKKLKAFYFPEKYSKKRLIEKGINEASGEFVFIAEKKSKYKRNAIEKEIKNGSHLKKNGDSLREDLPPKIAYIIPAIGISGGIGVVLQHTNRLLKQGYDISIISHNPHLKADWFDSEVPIIHASSKQEYLLDNIDILVATHWTTAFYMDLLPARRKVYFVQSDERRFNPEDENELKAIDATYRIDCEYMTEAIWIQLWLKEEFGHNAYYVPNGIDLDIFHKTAPLKEKGNKPRVLIEGAIEVWFKGMDDAYNAIKDLDIEIWIVSCEGKPKEGWRYDQFFQNVPINDMKKIYSSCDIFLKMSKVEGFFGPPMEAMACGCAVIVGKVTGFDEYIMDGKNALVVEEGDVAAARSAVQQLISGRNLRQKLIDGGYETVKQWSWDKSTNMLQKVIKNEPVEVFYTDCFPERYEFKRNEDLAVLAR